MKNFQDIFFKHKFLLLILFTTFIIFMFFYTKNLEGTFFDIPAMFLAFFSPIHNNANAFIVYDDTRTRFLNNLLVAIPFNILFIFLKNTSLANLIRIYSVSYFIVPFFLLICNYFAARRTKRYDIAVIAFVFYFLFSIPNAVWAVRELHMTILGYFLILSYFLSKEKLGLKDLIPIGLLIIYLFESFETVMIFGLLLFISATFYIKKQDDDNSWFKALIGVGGLIAVIYTPIRMLIIKFNTGLLDFGSGLSEWIEASKITLLRLFDGNLLIPLFALPLIVFLFFYKKDINFKSACIGILYLIFALFVIYNKTHFIPDTNIELLNYSFALWLLFPTIIALILLDYFKIDIDKLNPSFYSNLLVVTCIFGVINLLWQINTSFYFQKSNNYLKDLINKSEETIITIPKEDIEKYNYILRTNTCFGQSQRSVILNDDADNTKIIFPADYYEDYSQYCFADEENNYYVKENNIIVIQTTVSPLITKYWNLTKVAEKFEESGKIKTLHN